MHRAIGIDLVDDLTRWAVVDTSRPVAAGRTRSCAVIDGDEVDHVVSRLGQAEPIVVGTVPYGAEALVGRLLASVVGGTRAAHGDLAVALVHDDDLDDYRRSLLVEAARVGDVGPVTLVPRSTALELAATRPPIDGDLAAALGAAIALMSDDRRGVLGPVVAIGGGGAVGIATGAAVAATGHGGSATAAATGLAGPTGTPLTPAAGPAGSPLAPATGPTGTPLAPTAGPTGTPLTPTAGPTGTPLTPAAGPTGTPLPAPGPAATGKMSMPVPDGASLAGATTAVGRRRLGALIGAGAAVTIVAVGLVVLATRDDEPTVRPAATADAGDDVGDDAEVEASPVTVATADAAPVATAAVEPAPATTVATEAVPATSVAAATIPDGIDVAAFVGTWLTPCDPYIDGSGGANRGAWVFTLAGPGRLSFESRGFEHATPDCSDTGVDMSGDGHRGLFSTELEAIDTTTIDGLTAVVVRDTGDGTVGVMAIDGNGTLRVGGLEGPDVPTSFFPETGSRG